MKYDCENAPIILQGLLPNPFVQAKSFLNVLRCMTGWQIFFGVCGDYLGRKKVYLVTLIIIIVATIGQAMSASTVFGALYCNRIRTL